VGAQGEPIGEVGRRHAVDERKKFWVEEVLKGITPAMLKWWFAHLDGDMESRVGRSLATVSGTLSIMSMRTYVSRCSDGSIGPGAQIANLEFLARNPRYRVQVVATVERLDEDVFVHNIVVAGLHVATVERLDEDVFVHNIVVAGLHEARMEHTFDAAPGGTRVGHFFIVPGAPIPLLERVVPWWFSEDKGRAWLKHAVEEMGNLPNFLPRLYEQEFETGARDRSDGAAQVARA